MRILFVHGINEQDSTAQELKREWRSALVSGSDNARVIAQAQFDMAYYADAINSGSRTGERGFADLLSPSMKPGELEFIRAALSQLFPRARINRWTWMPIVASRHSALYRRSAKASAQMLDLAVGHDVKVSGTAAAIIRQIYAYLLDRNVQEAVDAIVFAKLQAFLSSDDQQKVIFAHSLGSLITFKLLRDHAEQLGNNSVQLFVTAGSPLNLVNRINKLSGVKERPGSTRRWLNLYDNKDLVALGKGLPQPPFGPGIQNDGKVDNDDDLLNHAATGYLRHRPLSEKILSLVL